MNLFNHTVGSFIFIHTLFSDMSPTCILLVLGSMTNTTQFFITISTTFTQKHHSTIHINLGILKLLFCQETFSEEAHSFWSSYTTLDSY